MALDLKTDGFDDSGSSPPFPDYPNHPEFRQAEPTHPSPDPLNHIKAPPSNNRFGKGVNSLLMRRVPRARGRPLLNKTITELDLPELRKYRRLVRRRKDSQQKFELLVQIGEEIHKQERRETKRLRKRRQQRTHAAREERAKQRQLERQKANAERIIDHWNESAPKFSTRHAYELSQMRPNVNYVFVHGPDCFLALTPKVEQALGGMPAGAVSRQSRHLGDFHCFDGRDWKLWDAGDVNRAKKLSALVGKYHRHAGIVDSTGKPESMAGGWAYTP